MAYTANLIWDEVKPLLDRGAKLKYAEIHRLRIDVDANIDKILTCETLEERTNEAKRLSERGYIFANDLLKIQQEIEKRIEIFRKRYSTYKTTRRNIIPQKIIRSKNKEREKQQYIERILPSSKKKKTGKNNHNYGLKRLLLNGVSVVYFLCRP